MGDTLPSEHRSKTWFLVALLLLVVVLAYLLWLWWGAVPPAPPPKTNVSTPPLEKLEDLAQFGPPPKVPKISTKKLPVDRNEHIRGSLTAPVSMIEYGYAGGPYSAILHPKLIELQDKYKGKINWVFKHYPKADNVIAHTAASAAECVADIVGKGDRFTPKANESFFKFMDIVMLTKTLNETAIYDAVKNIGVNVEETKKCVTSEKFKVAVAMDKYLARRDLDIKIMPSFVFRNNKTEEIRIVPGLNTVEYMKAVIAVFK